MNIRLTDHVRERMAQRTIYEWQLRLALNSPVSVTQTPDDSLCYLGVVGGQLLKVWVVDPTPADGTLIIKSAAWKG